MKRAREGGDEDDGVDGGEGGSDVKSNEEAQQTKRQRVGVALPSGFLETLNTLKFDMFTLEKDQVVEAMFELFRRQGFISTFNIKEETLRRFLERVRDVYQSPPYHNFRHALCVCHSVYYFFREIESINSKFLLPLERFALFVAAIGHDLDHPGFNNGFLVKTHDPLAITYSDRSVLEAHHTATLFRIIRSEGCNIFEGLTEKEYRDVRSWIITCIMATDMAGHFSLKDKFVQQARDFNFSEGSHRLLLMQFLLCCADLSNEARPWEIANQWTSRILEEFFRQSDKEKALGIEWLPFMDRDKVVPADSSVGFISGIVVPLYEALVAFFPILVPCLDEVRLHLKMWTAKQKENNTKMIYELIRSDQDALASGGIVPTKFHPNEFIVRKGDMGDEMFIILEGSVKVMNENMHVFDSMGAGQFFGEVGSLRQVARTAHVVAVDECLIYVITHDALTKLLERYPSHAITIRAIADERYAYAKAREGLNNAELVELGG